MTAMRQQKEATEHRLHGDQGNEFTMCGMAFDAYDSGDADEPILMAKPGEIVNCEDCRAVIDYAKKFKRYRQP